MSFHACAAPCMAAVVEALGQRSSRHAHTSLDTVIVRVLKWAGADPEKWGMDDKTQKHVSVLMENPCSSHLVSGLCASSEFS